MSEHTPSPKNEVEKLLGCIGYLRSVIRSGESLDEEEEAVLQSSIENARRFAADINKYFPSGADATREGKQEGRWRIGLKVPLNIYKDDVPICQAHTPEAAAEIVANGNAVKVSPELYQALSRWVAAEADFRMDYERDSRYLYKLENNAKCDLYTVASSELAQPKEKQER